MTSLHDQPSSADAARVVIVWTTWPSTRDPLELAEPLVDERLAACVNVLPPMESVYRWEGSVQREGERQLILKTTADRLEALHARMRSLHPYELPEFLVIDVLAAAPYREWVRESTRSG